MYEQIKSHYETLKQEVIKASSYGLEQAYAYIQYEDIEFYVENTSPVDFQFGVWFADNDKYYLNDDLETICQLVEFVL